MAEKIKTLHPDQGKQGVNIDRDKYEAIRGAILSALKERDELTFQELGNKVEAAVAGNFEGSVMWYYTTVKLDLEARGHIERTSGSPQRIRLVRDGGAK